MPLHSLPGNLVIAAEGVYFPMANVAEHRVTCVVTRAVLSQLAGRKLPIEELLNFRLFRRHIEGIASAEYDKRRATARTFTIDLKELRQLPNCS